VPCCSVMTPAIPKLPMHATPSAVIRMFPWAGPLLARARNQETVFTHRIDTAMYNVQ